MAEKPPETGNRLIHIIIPAATALLVAIIGLGTAIYQTEKPIQLTAVAQTAQSITLTAGAPALLTKTSPAEVAPTLVAETVQAVLIATEAAQTIQAQPSNTQPSQTTATPLPTAANTQVAPSITIINKLRLPIHIAIDKIDKGAIGEGSDKTYLLDSFPVMVDWNVIKETTVKGRPLGDDMSGTFTGINSGNTLTIDNVIGDQAFFYPIISNTTGTDCDVVINKGWKSENVTKAVIPANTNNVGMGYYKLFTNSNVTLTCGADTWWWGLQTDNNPSDTSFFGDVEKETGVISFTLKP